MKPLRTIQLAAFVLVVTVYVVLRFWHLTDSCLWFDEIFSVHAAEHSWDTILSFVALDLIHPPLFYVLLKIWIAIGGESLFWLRLFSVIFAVVSLVPFILFLREMKQKRWVEIVAIFLLAVNGSLIKYSQEVRMYSLLLCLSLFSMWLFARYFVRGKSFVPLVCINLLLIYTHYFGWFVVLSEIAAILLFQHIKWRRMFLMFAVLLACFTPWVYAVWNAAHAGSDFGQNIGWVTRPKLFDIFQFVLDLIEPIYYQATNIDPASIYRVSLPILLIVLTAVCFYFATWKQHNEPERQYIKLLGLFTVFPLTIAFVISWLLPYSIWGTRHLIIVFPPFAIGIARAVITMSVSSRKSVFVTLLILFTGYGFFIQASRPGEQTVLCSFESMGPQLEQRIKQFELRRKVPMYVAEDLAAYLLWFGSRKESPDIVKLVGVPGTAEDKAFFLPRGFNEIRVMPVEQLDADEFWFVYRAKTRDLDQPPLSYFFDRDFFIYGEQVYKAGEYKVFAILLQKRHSLKRYGEVSDDRFTRESALVELKDCERHPRDICFDVAGFLMSLYVNGDNTLLGPLMETGLKSDTSYAVGFGMYFSDILQMQTTTFLSSLKNMAKTDQTELCFRAIRADGGGNGEYWENDVRAKLDLIKAISSDPLAHAAAVCLAELDKYQVEAK